MWYGWAGTELEIDLTQKKIKKNPGNRELYEKYLGGLGLITRHFWDRVSPETEPFSADNLLIFGVGPLVGTAASAACRTAAVTRSPITNYLTTAGMSGFWGPELKFAGYDTLTLSGKSAGPVYIYINNDNVEIRDASHLWGKSVPDTQRLLREELKDDGLQIMCIGLAGENRVYFASIEHGPGSSISQNGAGAVMGDKKVKAIAVRGNKNIDLARPAPFYKACDDFMARSAFIDNGGSARWPDPVNGNLYLNIAEKGQGNRYYRNFEFIRPWKKVQEDYMDFLMERQGLMVSCFNCEVPCIYSLHHPDDGEIVYWKCHSRHFIMGAGDIQNYDYSLRCFSLLQRYGMDTHWISSICRFAIDLYKKGILTKKDTGGLALEWGKPEVIPALLEKIARREDIGDVLANGIHQAARDIGGGAEKYAYHFRRHFFRGGGFNSISAILRQLIGDRPGNFGIYWRTWGYDELLQGLKDPGEIERWKDFIAVALDETRIEKIDSGMLGRRLAYEAECNFLIDGTGFCRYRAQKDDNLVEKIGVDFQVELLSHATGLDLGYEEAIKCARRARVLTRAYNAILGERMKASDLPAWFLPRNLQYLLADDRILVSRMMAETNQVGGFDAEGIPTGETLTELGLDDVAQELKRRGILPEPVSVREK